MKSRFLNKKPKQTKKQKQMFQKQRSHRLPFNTAKLWLSGLLFVLFLFVWSILIPPLQSTSAATSEYLNFQARLYNSAGNIVPDGTYNLEFKLHDHATNTGGAQGSCSGSCAWRETRTSTDQVTVRNGYFSVNLGSVTSLPDINWDQDLWLSMNIGGTGSPTWDGEMTPRIKLTAIPHALSAGQLNQDDGTNRGSLNFSSITNDPSILLPDASGTLALLQASTPGTPQTGHINLTGTIIAGSFEGDGSGLTDLHATNITTGTLADARLSSNVALYDATTANFTGTLQQSGDNVCTFAGNCIGGTAGYGDILQGGNDLGGSVAMVLGTVNDGDVNIKTNDTIRMTVSNTGQVGINNVAPANTLSVNTLSTADSSAQTALATGGSTNTGLLVQGTSGQTADLLQLQDSDGNVNASFNETGARLTLGRIASSGTVTQGLLTLGDGFSNNGATIQSATLTADQAYLLPNTTGTFVLTPGEAGSQTFESVSAMQQFTVPAGVTEIFVELRGAEGGVSAESGTGGGDGAIVSGTMDVTPGETLYFYVGGAGGTPTGGWNGGGDSYSDFRTGGGGGGATDIRRGGTGLTDRIVVAGGGGGGSGWYGNKYGGHGGDHNGQAGQNGGYPGEGGTQTEGGAGNGDGEDGVLGVGGDACPTCTSYTAGGGGGGGYYGGGAGDSGGSTYSGGGGGGGSSLVPAGMGVEVGNEGDGSIHVSWAVGTGTAGTIPVFDDNNTVIDSLISQSGSTVAIDAGLDVAGQALFQNQTDSTTAFQIQNAAGTTNLLPLTPLIIVYRLFGTALVLGSDSSPNRRQRRHVLRYHVQHLPLLRKRCLARLCHRYQWQHQSRW
ncbi:MAG: glycine rich domain-containing protein [Candidatus Saccharibacteria bacterium]|nr:glycine rich domain-containing protein [Candidatus Saccharibacteria bacterium]